MTTPSEWLWPGRIPLGGMTVLAGDPGVGKGLVAVAIAATVSTGGRWPEGTVGPGGPGSVLIFSEYDDPGRVLRPRLEAAGADLARVHALSGVQQADGSLAPFSLARDFALLEEEIDERGDVRLVIVDPAQKKSRLLCDLAAARNIAVLLVALLNKGTRLDLRRLAGSVVPVEASRMIWGLCEDPADAGRRCLIPMKGMIEDTPPNLAFRLVNHAVRWELSA